MQQTFDGRVRGRWHRRIDGNRIECELCPRRCRLTEGQRGYCFVRQCQDGEMWLAAWGRPRALAVDPIEKKPLYHFYPGTSCLSLGTAGCNLGCEYCQNWELSRSRDSIQETVSCTPLQLVKLARKTRVPCVAFTYNEPIVFAEYAIDAAQACREEGIRTVAVTAGYITEAPREVFFAHMDAANIDLKSMDSELYRRTCHGQLETILETLKYVKHETSCWLEVTTLLIGGHNDSDHQIRTLSEWVAGHLGCEVPLHFSAFRPAYHFDQHLPTPAESCERAVRIAKDCGLRYVYQGNVRSVTGQSTVCPRCSTVLIERRGYQIKNASMLSGKCMKCQAVVPGRYGDDSRA
jgi:pyruvate formate lyase activating enzyme